MIRVDRSALPEPAVLRQPYERGRNRDKTEEQVVLEALQAHLGEGKPLEDFRFDYSRYKEDEVKAGLDRLFAGKCAYCETFYSVTQPMDVEHWRPKGEIHLEDGTELRPGYYWLASRWDNLLPSCIDCNRARNQFDVVEEREVRLGKANQFPIPPDRQHVRSHDSEPDLSTEAPLLVNPCEEDPEPFFEYTDEGVIRPAAGLSEDDRRRAEASIRVYALNRSGLVTERREIVRQVDHRLHLVDQLKDLQEELEGDRPELAVVVEELIAVEVDALQALEDASRPYAGLARFLLRHAG